MTSHLLPRILTSRTAGPRVRIRLAPAASHTRNSTPYPEGRDRSQVVTSCELWSTLAETLDRVLQSILPVEPDRLQILVDVVARVHLPAFHIAPMGTML